MGGLERLGIGEDSVEECGRIGQGRLLCPLERVVEELLDARGDLVLLGRGSAIILIRRVSVSGLAQGTMP